MEQQERKKWLSKYRKRLRKSGIVHCLDDLEIKFTEGLIEVITEMYEEEGYSIEFIADLFDREVDEIFIGLFHQGRKGKVHRKMGTIDREALEVNYQ